MKSLFQLLTSGLIVPCLAAAPVAAEPNNPIADVAVLQALADPQYTTRRDATERLMWDEAVRGTDIARLYALADSPEARHRLIRVATHRVIADIRRRDFPQIGKGSIGIAHQALSGDLPPALGQPGILVARTFEGFPAHGRLRVGDVILGVDGTPLADNLRGNQAANLFIQAVQSRKAGAVISLSVLRDEQTLDIEFPLANLDALQQMYEPNGGGLKAAFAQAAQQAVWAMINGDPTAPTSEPRERNDSQRPASGVRRDISVAADGVDP